MARLPRLDLICAVALGAPGCVDGVLAIEPRTHGAQLPGAADVLAPRLLHEDLVTAAHNDDHDGPACVVRRSPGGRDGADQHPWTLALDGDRRSIRCDDIVTVARPGRDVVWVAASVYGVDDDEAPVRVALPGRDGVSMDENGTLVLGLDGGTGEVVAARNLDGHFARLVPLADGGVLILSAVGGLETARLARLDPDGAGVRAAVDIPYASGPLRHGTAGVALGAGAAVAFRSLRGDDPESVTTGIIAFDAALRERWRVELRAPVSGAAFGEHRVADLARSSRGIVLCGAADAGTTVFAQGVARVPLDAGGFVVELDDEGEVRRFTSVASGAVSACAVDDTDVVWGATGGSAVDAPVALFADDLSGWHEESPPLPIGDAGYTFVTGAVVLDGAPLFGLLAAGGADLSAVGGPTPPEQDGWHTEASVLAPTLDWLSRR